MKSALNQITMILQTVYGQLESVVHERTEEDMLKYGFVQIIDKTSYYKISSKTEMSSGILW